LLVCCHHDICWCLYGTSNNNGGLWCQFLNISMDIIIILFYKKNNKLIIKCNYDQQDFIWWLTNINNIVCLHATIQFPFGLVKISTVFRKSYLNNVYKAVIRFLSSGVQEMG
jgi:hypothetical protein